MTTRAQSTTPTGAPDDLAAYWMARKMSGAMKAEERRSFEEWLNAAEENRHAFAEMERALSLSDALDIDVLTAEFERELHEEASLKHTSTRRMAIAASVTLAAIAVTGALFLRNSAAPAPQVYATAIGDARAVALDDGSQIDLNTETRIEVAYSGAQRSVKLTAGQAFFNVEPDRARPFVIDAGDATITVTGTAFDVSKHGDGVVVSVLSGAVDVKPQFGPGAVLLAGDQVAVDADGATGAVIRFDPGDVFAWRAGKARFHERPLGEVVTELNRYFRTPISLGDAALETLPVTGEFDIRDQDAAIRALTLSFNLDAQPAPARIVLAPREQ
ncbi:MAG: FecR family protein [Parvularculaceae bacterium]